MSDVSKISENIATFVWNVRQFLDTISGNKKWAKYHTSETILRWNFRKLFKCVYVAEVHFFMKEDLCVKFEMT